jgi:hypothetical protein
MYRLWKNQLMVHNLVHSPHLNSLETIFHELHNLYSSASIIRMMKSRRMRWEGHVARIGGKRNAYKILVGKPEGKRPLGRSVGK